MYTLTKRRRQVADEILGSLEAFDEFLQAANKLEDTGAIPPAPYNDQIAYEILNTPFTF